MDTNLQHLLPGFFCLQLVIVNLKPSRLKCYTLSTLKHYFTFGSQIPHFWKSRGHPQNCYNILLLLQVNWQMETNYYPTHVRLTLASKLFQIDRYIFFLIFGGGGGAFKFWNMKLQLIIQLYVINAVLPFFLSCKL